MAGNAIKIDWAVDSIGIDSATLPDRYAPEGGLPAPDFVVSRNSLAEPISYYKNNSWDWSSYTPRGSKCILEFNAFIGNSEKVDYDSIIDEAKLIIFTITWLSIGSRLSPHTVLLYLKFLIAFFRCDIDNLGLIRSLSDESCIKRFIKDSSPHHTTYLVSLYSKLENVVDPIVNISPPSNKILNKLKQISRNYYTSHQQHSPLPSRIYLHLLSELKTHIDELYEVKDDLASMIDDFADNPLLCYKKQGQDRLLKSQGVPFEDRQYSPSMDKFVSRHSPQLISLFKKYGIINRIDFYALIHEVLNLVNLTFLVYTGARKVEAVNLREQCLKTKYIHGKKVYLVFGTTSKLNKGMLKQAVWTSSSEVKKAYDLALVVSSALYRFSGENGDNRILLPFALTRLTPSKQGKVKGDIEDNGTKSLLKSSSKFREAFHSMKVTKSDIQELKLIDPFRDWVTEQKIVIGKPWPLSAHQLRRSLALYASNSGLVTLPALKHQLQHMTEVMSAYYSNGSESAVNILGGNNDFIDDYNNDQHISEFASYVKNVLMTDSPSYGAHGNWINKSNGSQKQVLLGDRKKLMNQFRVRERGYIETLLGGCTSITPCKDKAMRNLVACLECTGSVIQPKRLENVIASQKNLIAKLNPGSVEYRTEEFELRTMVQYHDRITKNKSKGE